MNEETKRTVYASVNKQHGEDIEGPGLPGSAESSLLCTAATISKGRSAFEGQMLLESKPVNNNEFLYITLAVTER